MGGAGCFTGTMVGFERRTAARFGGAALHLGASGLLLLSTFRPWLHSGQRALDAYDLRSASQRLEVLDPQWVAGPLVVVPLVLAVAVAARWAGRRWVAHALALGTAAYLVVGVHATRDTGLPTGDGRTLALVGAGLTALATVAELLFCRHALGRGAGGNGGSLRVPSPVPSLDHRRDTR